MRIRLQKGNNRALFFALLGLLLGLIFVRYGLQVPFPRVILLLAAALIACLGDGDEIVALSVCCIPLYTSFQYTFTVAVCMIAYIAKCRSRIKINLAILPVLLLMCWELLHCFEYGISLEALVGSFVPLFLCTVLMCSDRKIDYPFIARALAVATAGICLVVLAKLLFAANFNLIYAFANLKRLGRGSESLAVSGAELNPNTIGILCVLAITGLLQLRISGQPQKGDIPMVLLLLVFGTLSSSRTYLVCLALMAVLLLFSQRGSLKQKLRFLAGVVAILALALLVLLLLFPDLMEFYFSRFLTKDITTGRMGLMEVYHRFFVSSPAITFFGVGLFDFNHKMLDVYHVSQTVPHNGTQELLIAWGIPGMLLFLLFLAAMVWRSRRSAGRHRLIHFIPLLILLAKAQAGQLLTSPYSMLALTFAYASMCWPFGETRRI